MVDEDLGRFLTIIIKQTVSMAKNKAKKRAEPTILIIYATFLLKASFFLAIMKIKPIDLGS